MDTIQKAELLKEEALYCSWGDTVHYNKPIHLFERCDGQFLYDANGVAYFDLQMQNSAANFGYRNAAYLDAAREQLDRLPQLASEYLTSEKVKLSKRIAQSVEMRWGLKGRVHFNVGGAQAIDDSLKIVAANKRTRRVFAFEGSYHGRTIGASAITSSYRYRADYGEFGNRAHFIPYPYCFRCPYKMRRESCELYCLRQVERLFESEYEAVVDPRTGRSEFAAFYAEPVQGTGGYIPPPEGYFEGLCVLLRQHNILFVADEIQMGFYRTGKLWSLEHFNVAPDILTFGKSLTNGLNPLSGLWAKEDLIAPDRFPPGSTHSTFGSNPLGCRLGLVTFDQIANEHLESHVADMGSYFLDGLRDLKTRHAAIGDVDGLGLALRIEVCEDDGFTPNQRLTRALKERAISKDLETDEGKMRLILDIGGRYKNVFTLAPALTIERRDIDRALMMLDQLFSEASV